ncbi:BMP family ABC transporter substrate-binding protein [Clostridium felsineum]|uniref:BMP family ABC transporter substrate-binding protein n=1 Tax=Clostridium felsineum TaxID=36839 RepID=UPI00214D45BA|nr:BMP family ABC transporter substrate-binding protein [Clostridium felsineum]MCR3758250.1 BMP family ABC transporter substrate-binding protein [Clostridium felsineum]
MAVLDEHYKEALKSGKTDYSLNGYLPCLEKILRNEDIVANINLGILDIQLKKIVGTYSHLRGICFSKSFMPLLDNDTEFKTKWSQLCNSHLNEGINHPIKVYEYLNQFYVIEGNKRVSILKFFGAASIAAEVIRLVPKKNDKSIINCIYYEFLNFYNKTKINNLWFTKKNSFNTLLNLLDSYTIKNNFSNNKYKHFMIFIYDTFREVYLKLDGEKLPITTADAFLEYAKIYGINEPIKEKELEKTLKEFMKELTHFNEKNVDILVDSSETSLNMLSTISNFITPSKNLKVAFVYARTIESSGWTYGHELGRQYVSTKLKGQITTSFVEGVPEDTNRAYNYIKELAEKGNNVIFTTSPIFRTATLKCSIEYPQIKFFNCSDDSPYTHMSCYFGRTYEPRFLTGLIAGAMTKTNIIGYSATSPTSEVIGSINAFALGTKLVNPYSKVKVAWTREWNSHSKFSNLETKLLKCGCDIISNRNLTLPRDETKKYGVYSMLCSFKENSNIPDRYLAAPIWNWGIYYENILNNILNNTFSTLLDMFNQNSKLINFWYGLKSGVVDVYYSKKYVPIEVQRLVEAMKKMITTYEFNPFTGPIYDNQNNLRLSSDELAAPDEILSMNWFVDNVDIIEPYIKEE